MVAAEVYQATRRARDVLAEAEAEAGRILEAARAERERVLSEAAEAGRRQGQARAAAALASAAAARDRLLESAGEDVLRLALAVARKVVGGEIAREGVAAAVAEEALGAARRRREVTLRVHPEDAPALRQQAGRLGDLLLRAACLGVREDPAVGRGGLLVETETGTIDARVETRLEEVEAALLAGAQ